jgi:hypothetical protein
MVLLPKGVGGDAVAGVRCGLGCEPGGTALAIEADVTDRHLLVAASGDRSVRHKCARYRAGRSGRASTAGGPGGMERR